MTTDLAKLGILIVDDEDGIRNILDRIFQSAGYRVECRANGVEGLKCFRESSFDVVIADRGMPEMNGEEMAARIKATHPHLPIILITGLSHLVTRPDLFVAVLSKPFRPGALMDLVVQATSAGCRCGD